MIFQYVAGVFLFTLLFSCINASQAQDVKRCGTTQMTKELYEKIADQFPQIDKVKEAYDLEFQEQVKVYEANKKTGCEDILVIPTVFHVIHENGPENIPDQTIVDAIKVLNEDYRLWNPDAAEIDGSFKSIIGEALIEFRLAKIDSVGNPTNGIERIVSSLTNAGDNSAKLNPWPRNRYLNIWVVKTVNGAAAYSNYPFWYHFLPNEDGIIVDHSYVGMGERTLTHEAGHWINLMHPWGNSNDPGLASNCSEDDDVSDTPLTEGVGDFSCDTNQITCGTLDNVQNYMDYSTCLPGMFTEGQVNRMRAALGMHWADRNNLWSVSNLASTGLYEGAVEFSSDMEVVCPGYAVSFEDESSNGICTWDWSFPGGVPSSSNERKPSVIYNTPGTYDVTLTVAANDTGQATIIKQDYITVSAAASLPYSESFANGFNWQVQGIGGNSWEYSSTSYDGNGGSIMIDNFNGSVNNDKDISIGPLLDLSILQDAQINFRVAYAAKSSGDGDNLKLNVSGDCGATWVENKYLIGPFLSGTNGVHSSAFTPADTSEWTLVIGAPIPASSLNENFRFMFEFTSQQGNNVYIDDINITGTYKPVPFLISPVNYEDEQPLSVLLDWGAVSGVSLYEYQIDTVSTFDSPFMISGTQTYIDASDIGPDTEYQLSGLDSNWSVYWRVRTNDGSTNSDWTSTWTFSTVESIVSGIYDYKLGKTSLKVFPNPVKGNASIVFSLEEPAYYLTLKVYDLMGREVETVYSLDNGVFPAGEHRFVLDNIEYPGIYLVKLEVENSSAHAKITVAK